MRLALISLKHNLEGAKIGKARQLILSSPEVRRLLRLLRDECRGLCLESVEPPASKAEMRLVCRNIQVLRLVETDIASCALLSLRSADDFFVHIRVAEPRVLLLPFSDAPLDQFVRLDFDASGSLQSVSVL